jgi:Ala-tRNA(Pro) deacylase
MDAREARLMAMLDALAIETRTVRHAPVFTVAEAKAERGRLPGMHTKNLFLKDKKDVLWLVVAEEDRPVDLKELRSKIGAATLSFARADLLRRVLGVEPGSVTPFAVINDGDRRVRVVLDAGLLQAELLNFHPLANTATTAITPDGLLRFLDATGHAPLVVAI